MFRRFSFSNVLAACPNATGAFLIRKTKQLHSTSKYATTMVEAGGGGGGEVDVTLLLVIVLLRHSEINVH